MGLFRNGYNGKLNGYNDEKMKSNTIKFPEGYGGNFIQAYPIPIRKDGELFVLELVDYPFYEKKVTLSYYMMYANSSDLKQEELEFLKFVLDNFEIYKKLIER